MGHVTTQVTFSNPTDRALTSTVEGLVDTGATLSVLPRSLADSLRLPITGQRRVRTATGEIELDTALVVIQIDGKSETNPVLVSDELTRALIGVVTLETLALSVDPTTGTLSEAETLLY